ncbi:hypothetical protein QR680_005708 [Steinernema hermaphroditum]|uniref:SCP domain-containing protein n=1 Tax=Steinernema hermaphroditum TaxID=289476 RepID=A0AA39HT30_9BILA|nr:hypothetical protein QR680_005708 [Steinernema hermaphroditum]
MGNSKSTPPKETSGDVTPDVNLEQYRLQHLKDSNDCRKKHGAEPLSLDNHLNKFAQEWAENLAKLNVMKHRLNNKYGENIAAGYPLSNVNAVKMWYDEVQKYNYQSATFAAGTGHFTQLVWKDSKRVGVGIAKASSGMYFIVANYDPAGNVMGHFAANVAKP